MNTCLHIGSVAYTFNSLLMLILKATPHLFESIFLFIVVVLDVLTGKMSRFFINSRSVLLIIFWNISMSAHLMFISSFATTNYTEFNNRVHVHHIIFDIGYCLIYFSYPLFGLLADIKVCRYTSIITGVYLSSLSWIIAGLAVIIKTSSHYNVLFYITSGVAYLLQVIGYSCVRSNIVQFNIDQAIGASGDELSTIICWHSLSLPVTFFIDVIVQCLINQFIIASYVLSGVAVSTVIITNFLFKHWLDTTSHIVNPVKLIGKVLKYACKNKYPRNRSALTYWEENYPSRLDLGKEKYGGPFTEEQVENVKVIMRLTPLFICIISLICAENINWIIYKQHEKLSFIDSFVSKRALYALVASLLILFYQFIIHPCFHKYIPSMLKRIGVGLVFSLFTTIYYVIMLACKDHFHFDTTSHKFTIVSQVLYGISFALILPTSLEFTIAQSPIEMRGLLVGLWYAARGVGYIFTINSEYLFMCEKDMTACQSVYYYIVKSVLVLIILIVFIILAKHYKLRVRENEINIHLIVEEHYERYMDQEIDYNNEKGRSLECTN